MVTYKVKLFGTGLRWDDQENKYERIDAPIEFSLFDFEEVGHFIGELTYAAEEPLRIEIKREEE